MLFFERNVEAQLAVIRCFRSPGRWRKEERETNWKDSDRVSFCMHAIPYFQTFDSVPVSYTHLDVYKRQV